MAATYVPVPFPAWGCRNRTRMESGIPLVRGAGLGDSGNRIDRGGRLDGSATLEPPVSLKLVGYEILEKRSKFTVSTYFPDFLNCSAYLHFLLTHIMFYWI